MNELSREELLRYLDFRQRSGSGQELTWFKMNAGTWPTIKVNGGKKLAAARFLAGVISAATVEIGRNRMFSERHLKMLSDLEAELESDLRWQTGDWATVRNALAVVVNALASTSMGVLFALGKPGGMVFSALYASMDEVFRKGAYFDPEAWNDAINKALIEAAAQEMLTQGNLLATLLIEFSKLAKALTELEDSDAERRALKKEIERQLEAIRKERQKYQNYYAEPRLLEVVSQELNRQPTYVISVANDYESFTGKKIAVNLPSLNTPSEIRLASIPIAGGMLPLSVLLAIRSREGAVRAAEAGAA